MIPNSGLHNVQTPILLSHRKNGEVYGPSKSIGCQGHSEIQSSAGEAEQNQKT